jgi:hypothetical protein
MNYREHESALSFAIRLLCQHPHNMLPHGTPRTTQMDRISSYRGMSVLLMRIRKLSPGHWMVLKACEREPHQSMAGDQRHCQIHSHLHRGT